MAEQDLKKFIHKVKELQRMIDSLDQVKGRREKLASCKDHNEVVEIAKLWGYDIGRRWGED